MGYHVPGTLRHHVPSPCGYYVPCTCCHNVPRTCSHYVPCTCRHNVPRTCCHDVPRTCCHDVSSACRNEITTIRVKRLHLDRLRLWSHRLLWLFVAAAKGTGQIGDARPHSADPQNSTHNFRSQEHIVVPGILGRRSRRGRRSVQREEGQRLGSKSHEKYHS